MPWSARLLHHPALLVLGVGQPSGQLQARRLPAIDMLLLHPGGPSLPPIWLDGVIALAALAGLLQLTRPGPARLGWLLAIDGLVGGLIVAGVQAHVPRDPRQTRGLARHRDGDGRSRPADFGGGCWHQTAFPADPNDFGWRQPLALVLATAAAATPLAAGAFWIATAPGTYCIRARSTSCRRSSLPSPLRTARPELWCSSPGPRARSTTRCCVIAISSWATPTCSSDPGQVAVVGAAVADLSAGVGQRAATELSHAGIRYVLVPESADAGLGARIAAGGGVLPQNTSARMAGLGGAGQCRPSCDRRYWGRRLAVAGRSGRRRAARTGRCRSRSRWVRGCWC